MPEFLYRYKFTMKPGTPCWSSAELRQSARSQTITLMLTFLEVAPSQYQTIEGTPEPQTLQAACLQICPEPRAR
jgi:hypothetical protein